MTNCEFPAQCVNTSSGFSCICSDGYVGVPPQCEGECYTLGTYLQSKGLAEKLYAVILDTTLIVLPRLKLLFRVPIDFFALLREIVMFPEFLFRKA